MRRPYSFRELDDRANQLARFLLAQGVKPGDRVALLFDKSVDTYVALLAVLKVHAAYVPLDAGFPNDRIGFILRGCRSARRSSRCRRFASKLATLSRADDLPRPRGRRSARSRRRG